MTSAARSTSQSVFVDTSAFYALADPTDGHHADATLIARQLATPPSRLVTTNLILAESHALLLARRGRAAAFRWLEVVDRSQIAVVRLLPEDERKARQILAQYDDKNFSLTDATSFAVMERLRVGSAFAFDRNFAQYGLQVLAPP